MEQQHRQRFLGGKPRQVVDQQPGQPGGEADHARVARRIAQRQLVGHRAALAEAADHERPRVDRVAGARLLDEAAQQVGAMLELGDRRRLPRHQRVPAMTSLAAADRHRDGALRAEHQRAAVVHHGSQAEQVVGAGAPAVDQDQGWERTLAAGNVRGVEQLAGAHGGREDTASAAAGDGRTGPQRLAACGRTAARRPAACGPGGCHTPGAYD